jgi:hypothetical protein
MQRTYSQISAFFSAFVLLAIQGSYFDALAGSPQLNGGVYELASSGRVLGRWCDEMIPGKRKFRREITIRDSGDGELVLNSVYFDGSKGSDRLREKGMNVFIVVGSAHGDGYRLSASTGALQIFDNDGLIRVARRLENTKKPGDCL